MTNFEIYKKTIGFSFRRIFLDILYFIFVAAVATLGYFITEKIWSMGLIGLGVGALLSIIILAIFVKFISFKYKAGQIAMMTKGITEGKLEGNVIAQGKQAVKERFRTVAAYFFITGAIKGIFRQIGRGITRIGRTVGGDSGELIGSTVDSFIQTVIAYLCDCCLGWVFFRPNVSSTKATCEGAVIFFKHGKTFAKNIGRIFGIGLLSLILIGGLFGGIIYLILWSQSSLLNGAYAEIAEAIARSGETGWFADLLQNPATLPIFFAVIGGIIIWAFIHSAFIRPFVLTGVLRNYIESGKNDIPSDASMNELAAKSPKFKKLHNSEI